MNGKIVFSVVLVLVMSLVSVSAVLNTMIGGNDKPYIVEVNVVEGWNILAGTLPDEGILEGSEIKASDIKAVWYYAPSLGKYLQVHPDADDLFGQVDDDVVLTSAMWFYSSKSGTMFYSTLEDYQSLDMRKLEKGWNFVTITPDMVVDVNLATPEEESKHTLNSMKGSCDWTEIYAYAKEAGEMRWLDLLNNPNFVDKEALDYSMVGTGLVIKVSNDCNLGSAGSGSVGNIPPLPN